MEAFKQSGINRDISGMNKLQFTEVQYSQSGSYIDYQNKSKHEIEVVYGKSKNNQIFELNITKSNIYLDGHKYNIVLNNDNEMYAFAVLEGSAATSFVSLLIDKEHGTLIYNACVSREFMGTKSKTFIATCSGAWTE